MRNSGILLLLSAFFTFFSLSASDISNRYRSPRNPERKVRRTTELIVLHTTEAPARSSLNKVSERGECHFCVTEEGSVYAIVDRDREAFHAGRSMWNGKEDVDKFSVGIECVGYHNKPMGSVQLRAIARLVKELQAMYRIPDHSVVAHSHVAYGAPNKWQKRRHRGRKRCGMLFATTTVRRILGLKTRPGGDADVRAGRLAIGDPYLNQVLYGGLDFLANRSEKPRNPKPPAPRSSVVAPKPSVVARKPSVVRASPKTVADLKARGYKPCGTIGPGRSAVKIAGDRWKAPTTYYVIRGRLTPGSSVDPSRLEKGTEIWMK